MLRDHGYGASASRGMPVHVPAFAGTKLLLGDRGIYECEQLAEGCYPIAPWPGIKLTTVKSLVQHRNRYTIEPPIVTTVSLKRNCMETRSKCYSMMAVLHWTGKGKVCHTPGGV